MASLNVIPIGNSSKSKSNRKINQSKKLFNETLLLCNKCPNISRLIKKYDKSQGFPLEHRKLYIAARMEWNYLN